MAKLILKNVNLLVLKSLVADALSKLLNEAGSPDSDNVNNKASRRRCALHDSFVLEQWRDS